MLDPTNALQTYQSSCQGKASRIEQFMARRDTFDLTRYKADFLADMVDTVVEQLEAMEDLWDDVINIINKYPSGSRNDTLHSCDGKVRNLDVDEVGFQQNTSDIWPLHQSSNRGFSRI